MEQIVMKPKEWLKPPRHSRASFNQAELRQLAENITAIGFLCPILALASGEVVAGDRRRLAAMLSDVITDVPVHIVSDSLAARDIRIRRISENLQRVDLSFWEKYLECRGFKDDEPELTAKEIADLIHVDASTVTRLLCLDHCVEAVRVAAKEKRIGMKATYEISKADKEEQEALLAEALAGGAERVAKARRKPSGTVPAERVKRSRFARPSGSVVTLTAKVSTLEDAIKELADLIADMRRADTKGITLKTFIDECRDKADASQQPS